MRRKIKRIWLRPVLTLLFVSCNTNKIDNGIKYNSDINVTDILNRKEYSHLIKDEAFKEYFEDYTETWEEVSLLTHKSAKFNADSELSKDKDATIGNVFGLLSSGVSTSVGFLTSTSLESLKEEEKELFKEYSKDKISTILKLKSELKENFYDKLSRSSLSREYDKVKRYQVNYWSINKFLKKDELLEEEIEELATLMDEFIIEAFNLRKQLLLSKVTGNETKIDSLSSYSNQIFKNINVSHSDFDNGYNLCYNYFYSLEKVSKKYRELSSKLEEGKSLWSENKVKSLFFILMDIENRLETQLLIQDQSIIN